MVKRKITRLRDLIRFGLLPGYVLGKLGKLGIVVEPYYRTGEGVVDIRPRFTENLEDYTFAFFGPEDMKTIAELDDDPGLESVFL